MSAAKHKTSAIRVCAVFLVLSTAFRCFGIWVPQLSAQAQKVPHTGYCSKRMADTKPWMIQNLDVDNIPSCCYQDVETNCHRYGRLYTWESARLACESLGSGWRLPTDDERRRMAKHYGGVSADSDDKGKAAYQALLDGGSSGFDARLRRWPLQRWPLCTIGRAWNLLDGIRD